MNETNIMSKKDIFKTIGFIFATMFGILFSIIYLFSIIDNIVYSIAYKHYDGTVISTNAVESYVSTTTRYRKTSSGSKQKITEHTTKYKQDIIVSFNNTESEMLDVSVDKNGYSINDKVSIYVSKTNPDNAKIHADVSNKTYLLKFFAFIGGYWTIYIILYKKFKQKNNINKSPTYLN